MAKHELVGFVSDATGGEFQIFEALPVLVQDERANHVARGFNWSLETLVELSIGDEDFVSFIPASSHVGIDDGDTVWIAGGSFVEGIKNCAYTVADGFTLGAWETLPGGLRWSYGSRVKFRELMSGLAGRLEVALHNLLFDPLEKSHRGSSQIYELFAAVPTQATRERQVSRGLYFEQIRDEYSANFVAEESVSMYGFFETKSQYRLAVTELRDALLSERLSERNRPAHAGVWFSSAAESLVSERSNERTEILKILMRNSTQRIEMLERG